MPPLTVTTCTKCKRQQANIYDDREKNDGILRQIGWRKLLEGSWRCPFCKPN
jgi:hypothetical protein